MKKLKSFVFLGIFVALIGFAMAVLNAPTALVASNNASIAYDEGNFFVNWTSGGGSAPVNYTIYVYSGSELYLIADNDSALGYHFSNTTEANYSFTIEAVNDTGRENSTINLSMYVDSTGPTITMPQFTNGTSSQNSAMLILNISVSDALSGVTGSACLIDVNGTNQSIVVSSGWCNTSAINLTGLSDGNRTIRVWVNDTINNFALNNSYVVQVDTTAPTVSLSCSPKVVSVNEVVTCGCSGTATSGIASTSYTAKPSTSSKGVFSTSCTVTDNSGNSATSSFTYEVTGGSSSGSTPKTYAWKTQYTTESELTNGVKKQIAVKERVRITVANEYHHVGLIEVTTSTAKINISSTPQIATMSIGDTRKFEVSGDDYYDIIVTLNAISGGKADITIKSIQEKITSEAKETEDAKEDDAKVQLEKDAPKESTSSSTAIIIAIIIAGLAYMIYNRMKKKEF